MADQYRSTQNKPTLAEDLAGYGIARLGEVTTQVPIRYANRPAGRTLDPRAVLPEDPRIPQLEKTIKQLRRREQEQDREIARLVDRVALLEQQMAERIATDMPDREAAMLTRQFIQAVDRARPILEWPDDWDGEGSPSYRAETLDRVQTFLVEGALALWRMHSRTAPAPQVAAGPDGSIDLHWQSNGRELLVNIPVESDEVGSFYGDDAEGKIKGEIGGSVDAAWLLGWLAR